MISHSADAHHVALKGTVIHVQFQPFMRFDTMHEANRFLWSLGYMLGFYDRELGQEYVKPKKLK